MSARREQWLNWSSVRLMIQWSLVRDSQLLLSIIKAYPRGRDRPYCYIDLEKVQLCQPNMPLFVQIFCQKKLTVVLLTLVGAFIW